MEYSKYKKALEYSYALGATLVLELINKRPNDIIHIYIHSKANMDLINKIKELANAKEINYSSNDKIFNRLSNKENCYVLAVFLKKYKKLDSNKNHIVLVNPSSAGNLGTIIRTAIAFDVKILL